MRAGAIMTGAAAIALTLVLSSGAAMAQTTAASSARVPAVSVNDAQSAARAAPQRRGLRLNTNGRWGVDFNVSPSARRESEAAFGEVEAGAYYRVSPRLEVGASAGLTEAGRDPARPAPTERRPESRFRLESIFRF